MTTTKSQNKGNLGGLKISTVRITPNSQFGYEGWGRIELNSEKNSQEKGYSNGRYVSEIRSTQIGYKGD